MSGAVIVIGAGGHAKVAIAALQASGRRVDACYERAPELIGTEVLGVPVKDERQLPEGCDAIVTIGDNVRRKVVVQAFEGKVRWTTAVHPSAIVHPSVQLGEGSVVFAGAVIQPDARLGRHVIVNTAASVDHDSVIEDFVHIAPQVALAGGVEVGEGAFLGIAAAVIPYRKVGAWATVGAGGVVVRDLSAHVTAVGVPAKPR